MPMDFLGLVFGIPPASSSSFSDKMTPSCFSDRADLHYVSTSPNDIDDWTPTMRCSKQMTKWDPADQISTMQMSLLLIDICIFRTRISNHVAKNSSMLQSSLYVNQQSRDWNGKFQSTSNIGHSPSWTETWWAGPLTVNNMFQSLNSFHPVRWIIVLVSNVGSQFTFTRPTGD